MNPFRFRGEIPSSKSGLNRAWLAKSYFPNLSISGDSNCDDVRYMKLGLLHLAQKKEIFCGDAGTVLRFLALRASREPGVWTLKGSPRLMSRPHQDLLFILDQLGVSAHLISETLVINSQGWKKSMVPIQIHREKSSQFASSLLLNSWNLDFPLHFQLIGSLHSEGYWNMSVEMARELGMKMDQSKDQFTVPAGQKVTASSVHVEMDFSSAFAVAAAAALSGEAVLEKYPSISHQPDQVFIEALQKMGVPIHRGLGEIEIQKAQKLKSIKMNLSSTPDLFPVMSVLCAFAEGESVLFGAPQLAHKESNRIKKTEELLKIVGVHCKATSEGLEIHGLPKSWIPKPTEFFPDEDHRMAMAAGLFKLKNFPIKIRQPEVVNKSFPDFWKILGINP